MPGLSRVLATALMLSIASSAHAETKFFSVGSGPTGGVYYPLGGGIATLIAKYVPDVRATAEATSGSVENVKLVGGDATYFGLTSADVVQEAAKGTGTFDGAPLDVRTIASLYPNIIQIVALKASGIATVADLKGKRVATGTPGSGIEILSNRILTAAGMDPNTDIERAKLATGDAVNALRDGKVDAMVFSGGVPAPAIADLAAAPGFDIVILPTAELVSDLNAKYGDNLYNEQTIAAGAYGGDIASPVAALGVWNLLVANAALPDGDAEAVCSALLGHLGEFAQVHPAAKGVKVERQKQANSTAPFHPGAAKCIAALGGSLD